jgi:2'-5' RNA ligase
VRLWQQIRPITSVDPTAGVPIRSGLGVALRLLEGVVGLSVGRTFGLADDIIAGMASIEGRFQGTLFLPEPVSTVVQAIRASFDPHSAAEIAPHITLVYENEITSAAHLRERLAEISGAITPFRLRLSEPRTWGSGPEEGIYLSVEDVEGALAALRGRLTASLTCSPPASDFQPHVTLIHPGRTSPGSCREAWNSLHRGSEPIDAFIVGSVSVIRKSGGRWPVLDSFEFGDPSASPKS